MCIRDRRHPKHMRASRPAGEGPHRVVLADYGAQYPYLLEIARDCRRSTAVLYRNNDSALPLIDLLEREGVPYACRQREGFFFTNHLVRDLTDIPVSYTHLVATVCQSPSSPVMLTSTRYSVTMPLATVGRG